LVASEVVPLTVWVSHVWLASVLVAIVCSLLAMALIQSRLNAIWAMAANPARNSPAGAPGRYADTCH
jgi:hypothetical protein